MNWRDAMLRYQSIKASIEDDPYRLGWELHEAGFDRQWCEPGDESRGWMDARDRAVMQAHDEQTSILEWQRQEQLHAAYLSAISGGASDQKGDTV